MAVEVALALLQRQGQWLMQLRGDCPESLLLAAGDCAVGIWIRARRQSRPCCASFLKNSAGNHNGSTTPWNTAVWVKPGHRRPAAKPL
jgi:hypothetical protein